MAMNEIIITNQNDYETIGQNDTHWWNDLRSQPTLVDILNTNLDLNNNPEYSFEFLGTSDYTDNDEFMTFLSSNSHKFMILSTNIRSLRSKFDHPLYFLDQCQTAGNRIGVITLQETWFQESAGISHYDIPGYNCVSLPASATS